jgi:hypothetical protein
MDKIVVNLDSDTRECVACGFSDERPGDERPGEPDLTQELPTRVSRAASRRVDTPVEIVTLVDPKADT